MFSIGLQFEVSWKSYFVSVDMVYKQKCNWKEAIVGLKFENVHFHWGLLLKYPLNLLDLRPKNMRCI